MTSCWMCGGSAGQRAWVNWRQPVADSPGVGMRANPQKRASSGSPATCAEVLKPPGADLRTVRKVIPYSGGAMVVPQEPA